MDTVSQLLVTLIINNINILLNYALKATAHQRNQLINFSVQADNLIKNWVKFWQWKVIDDQIFTVSAGVNDLIIE